VTKPKLVRDRIPEIARRNGQDPIVHTADRDEYRRLLWAKLGEETQEFLTAEDQSESVGELADVLEVVHALAAELGVPLDELERIRAVKARERGGFAGRVVWSGNR
jgi:predicted house-cleaning noncanonical NTP pyrophosphatase (MazG superfamily)